MNTNKKIDQKKKRFYYWFLVIKDDSYANNLIECLESSATDHQQGQNPMNTDTAKGWDEFNKQIDFKNNIKQFDQGINQSNFYIESFIRFSSHRLLTAEEIIELQENFRISIDESYGDYHVAFFCRGDKEQPNNYYFLTE